MGQTGAGTPLPAGKTIFLYDGEPFAALVGAISLPLQARVQVGRRDDIINNVRGGIRSSDFDLYYDCHLAETSGTAPSFLD